MLVQPDPIKILEAFTASISKLTDEIVAESERIDKEDPDAERTKAYMTDRKTREWFNRGGNLGY